VIESIGRRSIAAIESVGRVGHFVADMTRALRDVGTWFGPTIVQMRRIGAELSRHIKPVVWKRS